MDMNIKEGEEKKINKHICIDTLHSSEERQCFFVKNLFT